ncbi:MAG: O-antigen ligase family protein, partial [Candidatus Shapirobacteria bacterium]|nr:O-antigen ligase family protein [Candidatus Shapirobacteria bacterium]
VIIYLVYQIKHRFPVFKNKITLLFVAYFIAIFLSFLNAVLIFQTDPTNILLLNLLRRFEYISLFFIVLSTIKSVSDLKFVYIATLLTSIAVAIYGYGQKYFQFPVVSTMNEEFSKGQLLQMDVWTRISSTFAGHYDLAAYLSVILIIIGAVTLLQKNFFVKLIQLLIWLILFDLLTLTASRVSIFAYFGGFIFVLLVIRKYLWIIPVTLLFLFSLFNSKDLNQRLLATIPALRYQFFTNQSSSPPTLVPTPTIAVIPTKSPPSITHTGPIVPVISLTPTPTIIRHPSTDEYLPIDTDVGVARSGEIRFNAEWPRAITAWQKSLLLGTGLGSITLATDNDYLRLLGESGLLGFITFLLIPLYFIIKSIPLIFSKKQSPRQLLVLIFLGGLLTTLANGLLIDIFESSKTAYLFWIMMAVYYRLLNYEK